MSFSASFYFVTEDTRCITKTLIDTGAGANRITSQAINFKNGNNILNPVIDIKFSSRLENVNYVRIQRSSAPAYGPYYYFITDITVKPSGLYTIRLRLDVLMTYATQIKALNVTLDRSETIYNGYLPDSDYTALGYRSIMCKAFDKGLTTNSFILMTTG